MENKFSSLWLCYSVPLCEAYFTNNLLTVESINLLYFGKEGNLITKTYHEINRKIVAGETVVLTAEEVSKMAEKYSAAEIAEKVDVVTTAIFGPMCSSGAFINFGHPTPPMRIEHITFNGVEAYGEITGAFAEEIAIACKNTILADQYATAFANKIINSAT
ncbi:MAG: homocysteine biosynthesis protein [Candidatus Marinimicrobia bacterium]|nr:homocysteine biosynthesis protein [Candidatus Neomarinimicrobiota bacterium]